ncbi:MAG: hypothetical protein IIB06_10630 [Bacteroidetes bacterium]|nr:hypothetical protein [Bacteroidota bacterium]
MKKKPTLKYKLFLFSLVLFVCSISNAQIGINTTSPASGALLDISSSDKGFLMTRIALTGTDDMTTITPSATTGLLLYNTVTAGALPVQVTPGFYYWNSSQWVRLYNQGYTLIYEQSAEVQASSSNTTYVLLPGLDTGSISIPFSGKYQIRMNASFAAGINQSDSSPYTTCSNEAATQGSISLWIETNGVPATSPVKANYLTSSSKCIQDVPYNSLAQNTTILWNIDLDVIDTYRFYVQGREWLPNDTGQGWFGKDTSGYSGANGENDALRGSMTITLIKQQ